VLNYHIIVSQCCDILLVVQVYAIHGRLSHGDVCSWRTRQTSGVVIHRHVQDYTQIGSASRSSS